MKERMRKYSVKHIKHVSVITSITIATLLLVSSIPSIIAAQPPSDWVVNGNEPFNWNYSPQTQVSPQSAQSLVVKWIFPVPAVPAAYPAFSNNQGVISTPLVVGGIAYFITDWYGIFAVNAATGQQLWLKQVPSLNLTTSQFHPAVNHPTHNGQMQYTYNVLGGPLFWFSTVDYQIFAFNALTGDLKLQFRWFDPSTKVPGSFGLWNPNSANMMMIDEKRGILTVGTENVDCQCEARGFLTGWNILASPPTQIWGPTFLMPPQDGSDPNWSLNSVGNMTNAWIFDATTLTAVNLKTLPAATLHTMLYNDWGNTGFNGTRSFAGLGVNWGGPWGLDPATGNLIISTSQPPPDQNATFRPGPDLWADSVLAINEQTGKYNWGFQSYPHDLVDYDCAWGTILANETINGTPQLDVIKTCKDGYLFNLNAATGAMNWVFNPPSLRRMLNGHNIPYIQQSPLNQTAMTQKWLSCTTMTAPNSGCMLSVTCPPNGCLEADPSYNPVTNMIYLAAYNGPSILGIGNIGCTYTSPCPTKIPGSGFISSGVNTTIWGVNAATGKPVWSFYAGTFGYRGGLTTSNGVVYIATPTGTIDLLDATTGKLLSAQFIGTPMVINPAIGTDSNGNTVIVIPGASYPVSGYPGHASPTPGFIAALGLGATPAASTTTTTVTAPGGPGTTSTITATTTTTVGAGATATVTAPGATSTVTASGATSTVTSMSAATTDNTTLYAVAAVAAIFIIATGFLALRGRKPAS